MASPKISEKSFIISMIVLFVVAIAAAFLYDAVAPVSTEPAGQLYLSKSVTDSSGQYTFKFYVEPPKMDYEVFYQGTTNIKKPRGRVRDDVKNSRNIEFRPGDGEVVVEYTSTGGARKTVTATAGPETPGTPAAAGP